MDTRGNLGTYPLTQVQGILRQFCDLKLPIEDILAGTRKRLDLNLLRELSGIKEAEAASLHSLLISHGFLDEIGLTPTTKGMALVAASGLPRISRAKALEIYQDFLSRVKKSDRLNGALRIGRVGLFGSMLSDSPQVGDIDIFLEFQMILEHEDFSPSTFEEREELSEALKISEYLSFHDEFGLPHGMTVADVRIDYVGDFFVPGYEPESVD